MKMIKYFCFLAFIFVSFLFTIDNVWAIPATGGFKCTYDIKYQNPIGQVEHNDLIISYGTYQGSNGKEGFVKQIVDSSKTVNSNLSLSYFVNHPDASASFNFVNVDTAKFYDSANDKWVCPKARYVVLKTGDALNPYIFFLYAGEGADDIKSYKTDAANAGSENSGEVAATGVIVQDPTAKEAESGDKKDDSIVTCAPVKSQGGVEIIMEINKNTNTAYFTIDGQKANSIENFTAGCKGSMDDVLFYCPKKIANAGDHSQDIVSYGKSCAEYLLEKNIDYNDYYNYNTNSTDKTTTDANGDTINKTGVNGGVQLESLSWDSLGEDANLNCNDKDVKALMEDISRYYRMIEILVPVLIIVLGSMDFGKAVLNQDKDAMNKSIQAFAKRCIAGLSIYFLPIILEVLLSMPGLPDSKSLLCGITMIVRNFL